MLLMIGLNLVVAVVFLGWDRHRQKRNGDTPQTPVRLLRPSDAQLSPRSLVIAFLSGAGILALEVLGLELLVDVRSGAEGSLAVVERPDLGRAMFLDNLYLLGSSRGRLLRSKPQTKNLRARVERQHHFAATVADRDRFSHIGPR
jgi:hypothetical protein